MAMDTTATGSLGRGVASNHHPNTRDATMNNAREMTIVTWAYAAGFGTSALPVAAYVQQREAPPSQLGGRCGGPERPRTHDRGPRRT